MSNQDAVAYIYLNVGVEVVDPNPDAVSYIYLNVGVTVVPPNPDALSYIYLNVDQAATVIPHLWSLQPSGGSPGVEVDVYGTGFVTTEDPDGSETQVRYGSTAMEVVVLPVVVGASGDAYTTNRSIPATGTPNVEYQRVTARVPTPAVDDDITALVGAESSNPLAFNVTPMAVTQRVHRDAMLVGEPYSGDWVLAISSYQEQSPVYATFPGAQVAMYEQIKAWDQHQQAHWGGRLLATEPIEVTVRGYIYDATEDIIQRRDVVLNVGPDGWVPFSLDLNLFDGAYFRSDLSFTSSTATLYLDRVDLDVETFIPFGGTPDFEPFTGDQVGGGYTYEAAATASLVTLAQAQVDDPTITDPGGPDQYLRIDYDAFSGEQWALLSMASRPVHEGNPVYFQADLWVPSGAEGIELRTVLLDGDGNTQWDREPTYDAWWDDNAEWVTVKSLGRAPDDGVLRVLAAGYENLGAGHLYLKNIYFGPGAQNLWYSSDFASGADGWTPGVDQSLSTAVHDGKVAIKVTGLSGNWGYLNLDDAIPYLLGEQFLIEFDLWVPEDLSLWPGYHISENVDPVGSGSISGGFSSVPRTPGWNRYAIKYDAGALMEGVQPGAQHRDFNLRLDINWQAASLREAWVADIQVVSVREPS